MIQNLSIPPVQAATFYVALLTLGALLLALLVVPQTTTNCGDGGHAGLAEMIRVHGNDVENVPFGLVLLIMLAVTDPLAWPLHVVGLCLVMRRIADAVGVSRSSRPNTGGAGMMLTWIAPTFGVVSLLVRLV